MHRSTRAIFASIAASGLGAVAATTFALPAQPMPERFADAGTIVWCEGERGHLEAGNTTQAAAYWSADIVTGDGVAVALGEDGLLVGDRLEGTFPARDGELGLHRMGDRPRDLSADSWPGQWTGTWEATHRTLRTRAVVPPRSL